MNTICWEENGSHLGYMIDYPDYWMEGKTEEELNEHLRDLHKERTSGQIPGVRNQPPCILPQLSSRPTK